MGKAFNCIALFFFGVVLSISAFGEEDNPIDLLNDPYDYSLSLVGQLPKYSGENPKDIDALVSDLDDFNLCMGYLLGDEDAGVILRYIDEFSEDDHKFLRFVLNDSVGYTRTLRRMTSAEFSMEAEEATELMFANSVYESYKYIAAYRTGLFKLKSSAISYEEFAEVALTSLSNLHLLSPDAEITNKLMVEFSLINWAYNQDQGLVEGAVSLNWPEEIRLKLKQNEDLRILNDSAVLLSVAIKSEESLTPFITRVRYLPLCRSLRIVRPELFRSAFEKESEGENGLLKDIESDMGRLLVAEIAIDLDLFSMAKQLLIDSNISPNNAYAHRRYIVALNSYSMGCVKVGELDDAKLGFAHLGMFYRNTVIAYDCHEHIEHLAKFAV